MARYPGATWRPVDRYQSAPLKRAMVAHRRFVLHTAVSAASSMHDYFNVAGRATPHFYVNGDGEIEQYIDTDYQATATLYGNPDSIAVESWDNYPNGWRNGSDVPVWTDAQVKALAGLAAWLHEQHGIPLVACPDSRDGSKGVAYHRQGIDPWRVSGGQFWSHSTGKVCPGDRRVAQVPTIIDAARRGPAAMEDEVTPEDIDRIADKVARSVWGREIGAKKNRHPASLHLLWASGSSRATRKQLVERTAAIRRAVERIPDPATKAEIRGLLENLDAEINLVVKDGDPA